MSFSISDPVLLSSYAFPQRALKVKTSPHRSPFASCAKTSNKNYAVVAAQADGVHVLDTNTLHAAASHTLGSHVSFACAPVLHTALSQEGLPRSTTYAVIASSLDVPAEERSRTIWSWRDDLPGDVQKERPKRSFVCPHEVFAILAPVEVPNHLLLVSQDGTVTLASTQHTDTSDLSLTATLASFADARLLHASLFSRAECTFVSPSSNGAVVVLVQSKGKQLFVTVLGVSESGTVDNLGRVTISASASTPIDPTDIRSVACSATGHLSILHGSGTWTSFQLHLLDQSALDILPTSEPIHLSKLHLTPNGMSTLALGSSLVLLCGLTTDPKPECALVLWDLQYRVVLGSQTFPLPSSLSTPIESVAVDLVQSTNAQSLVILSPSPSPKKLPATSDSTKKQRSTIYVVQHSVPARSTIAHAMGRAAQTKPWVAAETGTASESPLDNELETLLETMQNARAQKRLGAIDAAFFEWWNTKRKRLHTDPPLSDAFVRRVLNVVLADVKPPDAAPSSKVLQHLTARGAVSADMVEDGLVSAIRAGGDWESVRMVCEHVIDVPEDDVVAALHAVVVLHRASAHENVPAQDAMQVDPDVSAQAQPNTAVPSLEAFLSSVIALDTTVPALRAALHKHFRDPNDLMCMLGVLEGWLDQWDKAEAQLLPTQTPHGNAKKGEKGSAAGLPPLVKILAFLQTLLDASFLSLLTHAPARAHLRALLSYTEPALALLHNAEELRGPLEPFARAQQSKILRSGDRKEKVDWRKRKAMEREQVGVAVGLYRLEELVI